MNKLIKELIQKQDEELFKLLSQDFTIQEIIDLFWDGITDAYIIALNEAENIIGPVKPISIDKLRKMTYDGNAINTEQRIRDHINNNYPMMEINDVTVLNISDNDLKIALFTLLLRLFENEIKYVYNQVISSKMKEYPEEISFEIIAGDSCEYCRDIAAEIYPIEKVDIIGLPPYHPDCNCEVHWIKNK